MRLAIAVLFLLTTMHAQWQVQQSNTTADLRGIHSLGGGVAWASGSKGTVLRTMDNGTTWQACAVPPKAEALDFRGVQGFDAQTAIVMSSGKGDLSRLYKTTDGCRTWGLLFSDPDAEGFWDSISLTREPSGVIDGWLLGDPVGRQFTVYAITDTPATKMSASRFLAAREHTESLAADPALAGAFAASNSALLVVEHAYKTYSGAPPANAADYNAHLSLQSRVWFVTGGQDGSNFYERQSGVSEDFIAASTWTRLPLPVGLHTVNSGAFSLASHALSLVVVGGDYSKPDEVAHTAAYCTSETRDNWKASATFPHGYRSAVAYFAKSGAWITVGPNGTDVSTDDGRNWRPLRPGPQGAADEDQHWNALSLPFVVGPHGRIGLLRANALEGAK